MKKKLFFLLLFSLFFFPYDSFALSFVDCNNVEHEVQYQNYEDLRDWCYFTYFDSSIYSDLLIYHRRNSSACLIPTIGTEVYFALDRNTLYSRSPSQYKYVQIDNFSTIITDVSNSGIINLPSPTMDFSSVNVNKSDNSLYFSSNFTFDDIKTKYSCSPPDEPEEPEQPDSTTSISQNDFYVLMFLLSTLIWLLYFKWCFPNTRGRDL